MVCLRSFVVGVVLAAAPAAAYFTATQVAQHLDQLTSISVGLEGTAQSVSILNAILIVINAGPYPVCLFTRRV